MKKTRCWKAILGSICLCLVLVSISQIKANAASAEASIGKKNYTTLQQAINEAEPEQTIKVKKNIHLYGDDYLLIDGKSFTLDLNNKTITYTGDKDACQIKNHASVSIKNGTFKLTQKYAGVDYAWNNPALIYINGFSYLYIDNMTCMGGIYNEGEGYGFSEGAGTVGPGDCFIKSGKFTETIYNRGDLRIEGGEFRSKTNCIVIQSTQVEINGGTFKSKKEPIYATTVTGEGRAYSSAKKIRIHGGLFKSTEGESILAIRPKYYEKVDLEISGGDFYESASGGLYQLLENKIEPNIIITGGRLVKYGTKMQKLAIKKAEQTYKQEQLERKEKTFDIGAKAKGKLKYKVLNGGKYISVNKKGTVTIKQGIPAGIYKIKVIAAAIGKYNKETREVIIVIKKKGSDDYAD